MYSRHRAYLEEDGANDSKALLSKLIFIAERLLSTDDSEEGYRRVVIPRPTRPPRIGARLYVPIERGPPS